MLRWAVLFRMCFDQRFHLLSIHCSSPEEEEEVDVEMTEEDKEMEEDEEKKKMKKEEEEDEEKKKKVEEDEEKKKMKKKEEEEDEEKKKKMVEEDEEKKKMTKKEEEDEEKKKKKKKKKKMKEEEGEEEKKRMKRNEDEEKKKKKKKKEEDEEKKKKKNEDEEKKKKKNEDEEKVVEVKSSTNVYGRSRVSTRRRLKKPKQAENIKTNPTIAQMVNIYPLGRYEYALLNELQKWMKKSGQLVDVKTFKADSKLFRRLLTRLEWLWGDDINAICFRWRRRCAQFPDIYGKYFAIADCHLPTRLNGHHIKFCEQQETFEFDENFMQYFCGSEKKYIVKF